MPPFEVWKDVPGYEGYYQVSNWGRVRSAKREVPRGATRITIRSRMLSPSLVRGYPHVTLYKDKTLKGYYVHQLVLEAFVGPCPDGMESCHFPDRSPLNNRVGNLRWDTPKNNHQDKKAHGTYGRGGIMTGVKNGSALLREEDVREIRRKYSNREASQVQLGKEYGVTQAMISRIVLRQNWAHLT